MERVFGLLLKRRQAGGGADWIDGVRCRTGFGGGPGQQRAGDPEEPQRRLDGEGLVEAPVQRWSPAALLGVVHAGEIVDRKRGAVERLDGAGRQETRLGVCPNDAPCLEDEHRPPPARRRRRRSVADGIPQRRGDRSRIDLGIELLANLPPPGVDPGAEGVGGWRDGHGQTCACLRPRAPQHGRIVKGLDGG